MALRKKIGKTLAERAKKGPSFQKILERPFFKEAIEELQCKTRNAKQFYIDFDEELNKPQTKEVEIYCPFVSEKRWKLLKEDSINDALKKDINFTVYINSTENPFVRNKKFHQEVIDWLRSKNIQVFEYKFMHQKAVFFDNRVAYVGSLNVFSFSPLASKKTDVMLRFDVPQVVKALKLAIQGMLGEEEPEDEEE